MTAKSKPSKKQQIHLFRGYLRPIDDLWGGKQKWILGMAFRFYPIHYPAQGCCSLITHTFLQCGQRAKVRSVNSVHYGEMKREKPINSRNRVIFNESLGQWEVGKWFLIEQTFSRFIIITQKYIPDYISTPAPPYPQPPNTSPHQKSILAMSTDDPDTHRLWFWTQRSWMHRPQVDDSFAI